MNTYNRGTLVTVTCTFRNIEEALESPSDVDAFVIPPDGVEVEASPVEASTGIFTIEVETPDAGLYRTRWVGTGLEATAEHVFAVRRSYFAS